MNYKKIAIINLIIAISLFLKIGISIELAYTCLFFYACIALSFSDLKHKAVPDYLLLLTLMLSFVITPFSMLESLKNACLVSGGFVLLNFIVTFYVQNIKSRILKNKQLRTQEALGEGDIPVIASIVVILGLNNGLLAIFIAAVLTVLPSVYYYVVNKSLETPFIPYLVTGMMGVYFFNT